MTKNGERCEKCGSINTSGGLKNFSMTLSPQWGKILNPGTRYLICHDCGHEIPWVEETDCGSYDPVDKEVIPSNEWVEVYINMNTGKMYQYEGVEQDNVRS